MINEIKKPPWQFCQKRFNKIKKTKYLGFGEFLIFSKKYKKIGKNIKVTI